MSARIIFAGTPDFAAQHLKALLDAKFNIVAVYTQPDRPAGRGHKLTPSPVKALALEHGLEVLTPLNFKAEEDLQKFESFEADLAIVVAYGLILPQRVLDAPRLGCINVHASLLPQWRGAAPIQRALLSGQQTTGVSIMQIVKELDAGDVLTTATLPILEDDTSGSLFERLSVCGSEALVKAVPEILEGKLTPVPQDPAQVTYAAKLTKEESPLNFSKSSSELALQVRGLNPWPIATTTFADTTYKVFAAKAIEPSALPPQLDASGIASGGIVGVTSDGIVVKCGADASASASASTSASASAGDSESLLLLQVIQAPGKGKVAAADYARSKKDLFVRGQCFA